MRWELYLPRREEAYTAEHCRQSLSIDERVMANFDRQRSRRAPTSALTPLRRELDRLFDDYLSSRQGEGRGRAAWTPRMDVAETEEAYQISMDLPGVGKDDVQINYQQGRLIISGQRSDTSEEQGHQFHRRERLSGGFYRSLALPQNVRPDRIEASFSDGVLRIQVPKAEESKPRHIEIS